MKLKIQLDDLSFSFPAVEEPESCRAQAWQQIAKGLQTHVSLLGFNVLPPDHNLPFGTAVNNYFFVHAQNLIERDSHVNCELSLFFCLCYEIMKTPLNFSERETQNKDKFCSSPGRETYPSYLLYFCIIIWRTKVDYFDVPLQCSAPSGNI